MKLPRTLWRQSPDYPQLWVSMEKEIVFNKTDSFSFSLQAGDLLHKPKGKRLFVFTNKSNELMVRFTQPYFNKKGLVQIRRKMIPVDYIFNRTWTEIYEHLNELSSSM